MSAYPRHDAALAWALNEYGHHVTEIPMGTNRGPRVEHYQTFDWIPGGGYPWCVCFDQDAWAEGAGQPLPWATAGAYDLLHRALAARMVVPLERAVPGDPLVWSIGSGHASLLLEPWERGGLILSVDGNVSDRVDKRARPVSELAGAIHVPEKPVAVKAKPPSAQKVTSASGHTVLKPISKPAKLVLGKGKTLAKGKPGTEQPNDDDAAYWLWLRWQLGEGEFRGRGKAVERLRPKTLPERIPAVYWARKRAFVDRRRA